jgi:Protein of unknown function (DUF664)
VGGGVGGDGGGTVLAVPSADLMWFVDLALTDMGDILRELGDERVNVRPGLAGANSAYGIVTHCLGVMEYWGGATVADRQVTRDRAAEFTAQGTVEPLLTRMTEARGALVADLAGQDALAAPHQVRANPAHPVPYTDRKGAVLLHILEELFQHLGQMELIRDLVLAAS